MKKELCIKQIYDDFISKIILTEIEKQVLDLYIKDISIVSMSDKLSDLAQSKGDMMNDRDFIRWYLDTNYERVPFLYETVGETAALYPDKTLLITMKGHIVCAKNGVIYDSFDCRMRKVEDAWIVEPSC